MKKTTKPAKDMIEKITPAQIRKLTPKAEAARQGAEPLPAAKPAKARKAAKPEAQPEAKPAGKGATILSLIQRKGGATASELQTATGWQAHSVRGFLSTASKKQGLAISSAKNEAGERVYSS